MKNKYRLGNELLAGLIGLIAAFAMPLLAVNVLAARGLSGAAVYTSGLRALGLGDMGWGIGVCGLVGLVAALIISLTAYTLLNRVRGR